MDDHAIVELYWARDESAITETAAHYGAYLTCIARNILSDREDARESVSDTYLKAWHAIPPHRPTRLATWLGRITRETAIDRLRRQTRAKRGGGNYARSLDELAECLPAGNSTEETADRRALADAVGRFLRTLPADARTLFVLRYYYMDPLTEAAARCSMTLPRAKSLLFRTRQGLREYLTREGYDP